MQSQVIYKSAHYTACLMNDGSLIVTANKKQGGVRLIGETCQTWIDNIQEAASNNDTKEANFLCKAVYKANFCN